MESDSTYVDEGEQASESPHRVLPTSPPQAIASRGPETRVSLPTSPILERTAPVVVSDNPYSQVEDGRTYFSRQNRYFGPASTWLSWTEQERTTALSLDRVRSQDLSLHLFNGFGLKRKAQALSGGEAKRRKKAKERQSSLVAPATDESDTEHQTQRKDGGFRLAKSWTAWPMPPNLVPREELLPRMFVNGIHRLTNDFRPSADLEEWLMATATRFARESWNAREWERGENLAPALKRDMKVEHEDDPKLTSPPKDEMIDEDNQSQGSYAEEDVSPSAPAGDEPMFYSQPVGFDDEASSIKHEDSEGEEPEPDRRPVPIADDDKARQYFLPSARHILSKLDDLLIGLHKARYVYAAKPQGRARGRSTQSQSPDYSHSRGRASHSRSVSRRRARSSSANTDVSGASNVSTASNRHPRRIQKMGLRDWSDVVGVASLTGWDPSIVRRASERCGKLFGENMLFRTFHEGEGKEGVESHFTENLATATDEMTQFEEGTETSEADDEEVLVVRVSKPCIACQAAKSQCLPADDQTGGGRPCKLCIDNNTDCSRIRVKSMNDVRVCPHPSCPRHTIPFRKKYHLQRHLDSVHAPTARSMSRSRTTSGAPSSSDAYISDDDSCLISSPLPTSSPAKHEILCPLPSCHRSTQPFSKGKKLYEHIRRMHPEMDVDELKKIEARRRGESRGTWKDERRHRSRSRGLNTPRSQSRGEGQYRSRPAHTMAEDGDENEDAEDESQRSEKVIKDEE